MDFSAFLDTLQRHRVWRVVEASDAPPLGAAVETAMGWEIRYPPGDIEAARHRICATLNEDYDLLAEAPAHSFPAFRGEGRAYWFAMHCALSINQPGLLRAAERACPGAARLTHEQAYLGQAVYRELVDTTELGWTQLEVVEHAILHHGSPDPTEAYSRWRADGDAMVFWAGRVFAADGESASPSLRRQDLDGSTMFWDVDVGWGPRHTGTANTLSPGGTFAALDADGGAYMPQAGPLGAHPTRKVAYFDPKSGLQSMLDTQWPVELEIDFTSRGTVVDGLLVATQLARVERQGALFLVDLWDGGEARAVALPPPSGRAQYTVANEVWRTADPGVVVVRGFERDLEITDEGASSLTHRIVSLRFDVHDETFTPVHRSTTPYGDEIHLGLVADGRLLVAHRVPGSYAPEPQQWLLGLLSTETHQIDYSHSHCLSERPESWVLPMAEGFVIRSEVDGVARWELWGPPRSDGSGAP